MSSRYIPTSTPEQRALALERAVQLRRERAASLRSDFPYDTEAEWSRLAAEAGIRLPPYGVRVTTAGIRRFLGKVTVSVEEYLAWDGDRTLSDFARRNPNWPMKALAGVILEALDSGHMAATPPLGRAE